MINASQVKRHSISKRSRPSRNTPRKYRPRKCSLCHLLPYGYPFKASGRGEAQSTGCKAVTFWKQSWLEVNVQSELSVVFHGDDRAPLAPYIKSGSLSLAWCLPRVGLTKRPIYLTSSSIVGFQMPSTSALAAQKRIFQYRPEIP